MVREAGLEPARAYCTLEPESSESANSTTRADLLPVLKRKVVRVTGLEPVRRLSHAPQTCLSTSSSTLASLYSWDEQQIYYSYSPSICQPLFSHLFRKIRRPGGAGQRGAGPSVISVLFPSDAGAAPNAPRPDRRCTAAAAAPSAPVAEGPTSETGAAAPAAPR